MGSCPCGEPKKEVVAIDVNNLSLKTMIGVGGFGRVYKCDTEKGVAAVKVYNKKYAIAKKV